MGTGAKFSIEYEPVDLRKVDRADFCSSVFEVLELVNMAYRNYPDNKDKSPLWDLELMKSDKFFLGSFGHVVNKNIPDDLLLRVMSHVGDVDLCAPGWARDGIKFAAGYLEALTYTNKFSHNILEVKSTPSYVFLLCKSPNRAGGNIIYKVDIGLVKVPLGEQVPDFCYRYRSSCWEDTKIGIKAMYARFLLQAVCDLKKVRGIFASSGVVKVDPPSHTISLLGLREKYVQRGERLPSGDFVLEEKKPEYEQNMQRIYEFLLRGHFPVILLSDSMWSFFGLTNIIDNYFSNEEKLDIVEDFMRIIYDSDRYTSEKYKKGRIGAIDCLTSNIGISGSDQIRLRKKSRVREEEICHTL